MSEAPPVQKPATTPPPVIAPAAPPPSDNRRWVVLGLLVLIVLLAIAAYFLAPGLYEKQTDDAYVDTHLVSVIPKIPAYVQTLHVNDNSKVTAGDILVELDPRDYVVQVDLARANVAAAVGKLEEARNQVARFNLSLREVAELLLERGVSVTYETVRNWCDRFGAQFARRAKTTRGKPGSTWHLDEMSGASSIFCTASVLSRFASTLTMRPVVFLGTISCSLCLTHTIVLLAVIHLTHSPDTAWRALTMAALLVIPVSALTQFQVERPSIAFGRFLTGRSAADSSRAKQPV